MKAEFVETGIPVRAVDAARLVAVDRLVLDVYDTASPHTRRRMLAVVFAKVFAFASGADKEEMLARLLRPLGMLSLLSVANGAFTRFKLQEVAADGFVADVRQLDPDELVALVEWVQQVNFDALRTAAEIILSATELADSSVGSALAMMLARGAPTRRCDD